jgi:Ca-activated chloride channel family protein
MYEIIAGEAKPTGKTFDLDGKTYNQVTGGKTKIDLVIESLSNLIKSGKLSKSDRLCLIQFDDQASTIIGLTPGTKTQELEQAIKQLSNYSGGTRMGLGMRHALNLLGKETMTSRRTLIFTDGQTFDEDDCCNLAQEFAQKNIPITALGVGDYAEDLLINLSDTTGGRLFHIEGENASEIAVSINDLPNKIIEEFTSAQQDVITNLALSIKTVEGVKLTRIFRAYPEQAEFPLTQQPYPLGNISANDETVFILEFNLNSRPASRVRIAQFGITYEVPGKNRRGELPPANLVVQFMTGQLGAQVNSEVMGYLQQGNVTRLVKEATKIADTNPNKAEEMLNTAITLSKNIGNETMTRNLSQAQDELRKTKKISDSTRKTVKMGAKGKTVRMTDDPNEGLSDEKIRQISGT